MKIPSIAKRMRSKKHGCWPECYTFEIQTWKRTGASGIIESFGGHRQGNEAYWCDYSTGAKFR